MRRKIKGISEQPAANTPEGIFYGYVILPSNYEGDINRKKYISSCFQRERIAVLPERGCTPIFDCLILRSALRDVVFPKTPTNLGSGVAIMVDNSTGHAIVLGVVSKMDETSLGSENTVNLFKTSGDSSVSIVMDPESGQIIIQSKNKDKPAKLKINVSNLTKDCELDIGVSGKISIVSDGEIKAKSNVSITSTVKDSSILLNDTSVEILSKNDLNIKAGDGVINISEGKIKIENQVDNLKEIISDLITQISNITVSVPDPVSGALISGKPINSTAINLISQRLSTLLS